MSQTSLTDVHTVQILRLESTRGASGGDDASWTVTATRRCRIQPIRDRDRLEFAQRGVHVTHRLYFSNNPGIAEGCRIHFGSRVFEHPRVRNVNELDRLWVVNAVERMSPAAGE